MDTQLPPEFTTLQNSQLPDLNSMMDNILGPFMWLSLALTIVFVVLYALSIKRRRKVENAILDIQKILHEMNEREKQHSPSPAPQQNQDNERIIAAEPRQQS